VNASVALMIEAIRTSETSVNFYETTWRNIPQNYIDVRVCVCARVCACVRVRVRVCVSERDATVPKWVTHQPRNKDNEPIRNKASTGLTDTKISVNYGYYAHRP
jgi:hypothetical protein